MNRMEKIEALMQQERGYNSACKQQAEQYSWLDVAEMENVLLDDDGRVKEVSADVWNQFSQEHIVAFMIKHAIYVAPTTELLDTLDEIIGDRTCVEICAGMGYIGKGLDIEHITDSYIQQSKEIREIIEARGGVVTNPPTFVEKLEATEAVKKYRPHTVLCCYGTHKSTNIGSSGSDYGVDFGKVRKYCRRIIFVGSILTHRDNPMTHGTKAYRCEGLITRADPSYARIWVCERNY